MDVSLIIGLAGLLFIFYVIGKVLIALANTWVGDLLLGNDKRGVWVREKKHWDNAHCGSSPYNAIMYDDRLKSDDD